LSVPDRHEGGALYHGGILPTRRKLHYGPHPILGGEEVINLGVGNHLQVQGGTIRMAPIGTDGGTAMFGEYASIYKAGEVRVAGLIQDGGGYWYSNPTSDEFGVPLQAIDKFLQYDATHFCPDQKGAASPHVIPPTANAWFLVANGTAPLEQLKWQIELNGGLGLYAGLYCPLVGLPFRAQIVDAEFEVRVYTDRTQVEVGAGLFRKGTSSGSTAGSGADQVMISGGGSLATNYLGGTGSYIINVDSFTPHIARPDFYSYYLVCYLYLNGPLAADSGVEILSARVDYQIREASGEYFHPSL
jgi:hypothetical protein